MNLFLSLSTLLKTLQREDFCGEVSREQHLAISFSANTTFIFRTLQNENETFGRYQEIAQHSVWNLLIYFHASVSYFLNGFLHLLVDFNLTTEHFKAFVCACTQLLQKEFLKLH